MPSRSVGETLNGQMEVLSVGQAVDKRSGQTMLKTRVRFTSGPFKGIETLVKQPADTPKAKGTAAKKATSKSTGKAAGSKSTAKPKAAKKSTGKAKQVKPADNDEIDVEDLEDLDFDDE